MKNRSSCAGWKEQLQSKIQEVDIGFQYKEIDSRQSVTKEFIIPKAQKGDLFLLCAGWKEQLQSKIQEVDIGFQYKEIDSRQSVTKEFIIPKAQKGDLFLLQFDVENQDTSKDVSVDVEGIRNKLTEKNHIYYNENETFTYAVTLEEGQTQIQIKFGKGSYEIKHLKSYIWKNHADESKNQTLCQSKFLLDKRVTKGNKISRVTKGNKISGKIERKEAGMLITSIPFDENFTNRKKRGRNADYVDSF